MDAIPADKSPDATILKRSFSALGDLRVIYMH